MHVKKNKIGTFAEYIAIHEDDIALKPKNLSFEEAASIPLVGLTSYQALHDIMQLQKIKDFNSRWIWWCWYFRNSVSKNNGRYRYNNC